MTRGFLAGVFVSALVAVAVIFWWPALRPSPAPSAAIEPPQAAAALAPEASPAAPSAAPSSPAALAPDFTVTDLEGNVVRMADLRGKPVIVNFWATWCPPCRQEIPAFIELQRKYGPEGLRIVGISMDNARPEAVAEFVKVNGINYSVAMANSDVVQRYGGAELLPTSFYVGRDGRIVQSVTGLVSHDVMEENVRAAMAAPPAM